VVKGKAVGMDFKTMPSTDLINALRTVTINLVMNTDLLKLKENHEETNVKVHINSLSDFSVDFFQVKAECKIGK
jgi:hypothetical protein